MDVSAVHCPGDPVALDDPPLAPDALARVLGGERLADDLQIWQRRFRFSTVSWARALVDREIP